MTFLEENIKVILHLRRRVHQDNKMGLCFGAGISADLSFPKWNDLLKRIAEHEKVDGVDLLNTTDNLPSQAQYLFQKFYANYLLSKPGQKDAGIERRIAIKKWTEIVHECLYKDAYLDDKKIKTHPYLFNLVPLIKKTSMTVNYNFDDTIERLIYAYNDTINNENEGKGFEVVWQPSTQFRRQRGVIYHPNGFLPYQQTDGTSEHLVFMDQEFSDQLIDVGAGHYSCLLDYFSKNTMLFLGLSLNDNTLRHLLRIAARNNPGNVHYLIQWSHDDKKPTSAQQNTIAEANFSVYNLYTLFYTTEEIKKLSELLVMSEEDFKSNCDEIEDGIKTEYRYYLTGPVGVGKSTLINSLKSFSSFDEWVDRKNPLLVKPHGSLSETERRKIDAWINTQFRKKNRCIDEYRMGILIIDRSPLDPLYFIKSDDDEKSRANELMDAMVPKKGAIKSIAAGHIIYLNCDSGVLLSRLAVRGKDYKKEDIDEQIKRVTLFWKEKKVHEIDTTNLTIAQATKKVLKMILFEKYNEIDLHSVCQSCINV